MNNRLELAIIRGLDITAALLGLVLTVTLLAVLSVAIRGTSPGPSIFAQERIGRFGRRFICYKLRTMRAGTISAATHETSSASVTRIGGVLRKAKLDELPQFWNVLIGDMSLVGPRPCLPVQTELLEARSLRRVYEHRPGITGPGQVAGVDMSDPSRLALLDATYTDSPTILAYFRYIFLTLIGRGQGDFVREK